MHPDRLEPMECFFRRIELRDTLSAEEKAALTNAAGGVSVYPAGSDLVSEGDKPEESTLLVSGLASRCNTTFEGRRQITSLHVAGDFVDLHSFPLKVMDHSVAAISECRVVKYRHSELQKITENYPHLTRLLWMLTLMDAAIHRSWLVAMGGTSASAHLAHLICETYIRLESVGLADQYRMKFQVTQVDLGDILGISPVHVNRIIQEMRRVGLLVWERQTVTIPDWKRLVDAGQFDPTYLQLSRLPR